MLTRGQMKRIIERLPDSEINFLSQVMEGMLAVYKLERLSGAPVPVGNEKAREAITEPLNEIIQEIDASRQADPMRQVMITPVKELLDKINQEQTPQP